MTRALSRLTTVLCLAALAAPAGAETMYDVEVIVFEQPRERFSGDERWQPDVTIPRLDRAVAFGADGQAEPVLTADVPGDFQQLGRDEYRLDDERRRLEEASDYEVLAHEAWRQPGVAPEESVGVRLRAGDPISVDRPTAADGPTAAPLRIESIVAGARADPAPHTDPPEALEPLIAAGLLPGRHQVNPHPLDGTVRIEVRRYLHVHADLHYTTAVDWSEDDFGDRLQADASRRARAEAGDDSNGDADGAGNDEASAARTYTLPRNADDEPVISFPLVQQRRMRSGERHYLDHPVLGLLVLVTPHEAE